MDCGNKRREPPPPSADRSHYNGADCQKKYVRQPRQEIFALDIPFIELLITPFSNDCRLKFSGFIQGNDWLSTVHHSRFNSSRSANASALRSLAWLARRVPYKRAAGIYHAGHGLIVEGGSNMFCDRLKKIVASVFIATALILSAGFANSSASFGQDRYDRNREWRHRGWDRRDRDDLERIRLMDRDRRLRYRMNNSTRMVGYYDRYGRFHAYGFYDRFGRFHRY